MVLNTFFTEMVLPFLLIFVVVFAILQKSKILGENARQIDALVSLVIGLLVIGLPASRNFVVDFMPWVAVAIAVILVFFILYGFVAGDLSTMPPGLKITFGILAGLFTIGVVLYITGFWDILLSWLGGDNFGEGFWINAVIIILVIGAGAWVVLGSKGSGKETD